MMSDDIPKFIQTVLNRITKFELIESRPLRGFILHFATLDLKHFIFIEDAKGLHCLGWIEDAADCKEHLDYWENRLKSEIYFPTTVYNFPTERFPARTISLSPKESNNS